MPPSGPRFAGVGINGGPPVRAKILKKMQFEVFDCYAYGSRKKMYVSEAEATDFVSRSSDPETCAIGRSVPATMLKSTAGLRQVPVANVDFGGHASAGNSGRKIEK